VTSPSYWSSEPAVGRFICPNFANRRCPANSGPSHAVTIDPEHPQLLVTAPEAKSGHPRGLESALSGHCSKAPLPECGRGDRIPCRDLPMAAPRCRLLAVDQELP